MRAARYYGPGDVRVEEVPEPQVKQGQVKLKLAWCGICGSDLHAYHAPLPASTCPTKDEPHYVTGETLPITLGHEFSGTVVEVGPGVDPNKFKKGQKVVVEPLLSCKEKSCGPCAGGYRNACPHVSFLGIAGWGGGLSEYISVDQDLIYPLPDHISLEVGAMVEPLSVAWHAVKRSAFKPRDKCLIMGSGPIGLMVLKVLQARGASWIGVSEPSTQRRKMAQEHKASQVFNPRTEDVVAGAFKATNNQGADVVFDCAGIQASLDLAIKAVRPRGNIMDIALWDDPATIHMNNILFKEISLTGIIGYDRVHQEVVDALREGKFEGLEKLITRKISLDEVVEKGIKALMAEKDTQIKILVHP